MRDSGLLRYPLAHRLGRDAYQSADPYYREYSNAYQTLDGPHRDRQTLGGLRDRPEQFVSG